MRSIERARCGLLPALALICASVPEAAARTDPPLWSEVQPLVRQIRQSNPKLSETERQDLLTSYGALSSERDGLAATEQDIIARLSAVRSGLADLAQQSRDYEHDGAAWQGRREAHNARCNRTFTNPADVARCDEAGARLAEEKRVLDQREDEIAARTQRLSDAQSNARRDAADLQRRSRAWEQSLSSQLAEPLRVALARTVKTQTVRLTVKSFIRSLDLQSMAGDERPRAERAFGRLVNLNFSENPAAPQPTGNDFRLWSQVVIVATCRGDSLAAWKNSNLALRGGKELGILDAETSVMDALQISPPPGSSDDAPELTVSYAIKGRPNDAALPSFQVVRPRTCSSIWHRFKATLSCSDGDVQVAPTLTGSRFPTHRAWTNDDAQTTVDQGPLSDLWSCSPSDPELVR